MTIFRPLLCAACIFFSAALAVPSFAQAPQTAAPQSGAPGKAKPEKPKAAAKPAAKKLVDINTAGEAELRALKGIGDVRAAEIIKNRPYKGKDELVQKNIIPQSVYDQIKDQIVAKQH
jgi:DNA uptake protein ComE-like DNA-binding protein